VVDPIARIIFIGLGKALGPESKTFLLQNPPIVDREAPILP
jgi:hypothetical protein